MDKFTILEPTRLYASAANTGARIFSLGSSVQKPPSAPETIGRLPVDLHLLILANLPIPDFPSYSLCSRKTAALARDERIWESTWKSLGVEKHGLAVVLDDLEARARGQVAAARAAAPPTLTVDNTEDEFGDFTSVNVLAPNPEEMGDFVGAAQISEPSHSTTVLKSSFRSLYMRAHGLLKTTLPALLSPSHLILSELSRLIAPSLRHQAKTLRLLALFLSPTLQPVLQWQSFYSSLRWAMDRFDATLLTAFDLADSKGEENGMKEAAESSWEVWDGSGDWELGKVWAEKREVFYEQGRWEPLDNFRNGNLLDFDAMDEFVGHIIAVIVDDGSRATRVFPPASHVLVSFADRIANEVVSEYITPLLTHARQISLEVYLKATAATFRVAWRIVDAIQQASNRLGEPTIARTRAEDVIYQMFEINMDEYLDDEVENLRLTFDVICRQWDKKQSSTTSTSSDSGRFLGSHNPALVKRNVLTSFTNVLLLPVTIVPRTVGAVGAALTTSGSAAVQGIAMLNPQRWGGNAQNGYTTNLSSNYRNGQMLYEHDDDDDDFAPKEKQATLTAAPKASNGTESTNSLPKPLPSPRPSANKLELLLSLDLALELIHADREVLKRVETFAGYPSHYGQRVRDTIEEIFILVLQALNERHVTPGFATATEQMNTYKPADHEATTSVAPLVQFFELVHLGDTIQSIVQVYFDKELAPHIDRTDFLNPVVREKKRFENALDDSVAAGLNAGTHVLMNQVEHIILTLTKAREYCPPEDAPLELGPTQGCLEAIKCLEMHCKLLKGSTSKEVLEVFYQEVGLRLIGILQKHIKRQIISLTGGFQVIADLNAYHNFICSLKVPSIVADFSHLKMLGHVYVVEDARDVAQIVRDVTRYGGAYRPEDIYEFIQRRSDWKKIEKTVDKTMYNLSFKEDCVIC